MFASQDISNRERVCRFQYNVTLTAKSPGAVGSTTRLVGPSTPTAYQFTNLTPYSEYILQVIAINRKGSSTSLPKAFRTAEGGKGSSERIAAIGVATDHTLVQTNRPWEVLKIVLWDMKY